MIRVKPPDTPVKNDGGSGPITGSFTAASGSNRKFILIVNVHEEVSGNGTPTAVTLGGTNLTLIGSAILTTEKIYFYERNNASTGTVSVTYTGNCYSIMNWVEYIDCNQSAIATPASASSGAGLTASITYNGIQGGDEMIASYLFHWGAATTLTVPTSQETLWNASEGAGNFGTSAVSVKRGSGNITQTADNDSDSGQMWVAGAIRVIPYAYGIAYNSKQVSDSNAMTIYCRVPAGGLTKAFADVVVKMIGAPTQSLSTCTWGGTGMTQKSNHQNSSDTFDTIEHRYLALGNVSEGDVNIVCTPSASCRMIGMAKITANILQADPFHGTDTYADAATGTGITVNVSSATGEIVNDFASSSGMRLYTVGAGQTEVIEYQNYDTCAHSTEAGASSVTMSWTLDTSDSWHTVGWALKQDLETSSRIRRDNRLRPAIFMPGWAR